MSVRLHDQTTSPEYGHPQEPLVPPPIQPPVDRFPNEVLIAVLGQLIPSLGPGMHKALVCATHVCGRWRTVAIGTPSLWTSFSLEGDALTQAFLTRSQDLRLSIHAPTQSDLRILRPHIHRLRCLDIDSEGPIFMPTLAEDLPQPAPHIEELYITAGRWGVGFPEDPRCIFEGTTPMLRVLHLKGAFSPSVKGMTQDVRDLKLACIRGADGFSFGALLEILRNCPRLEKLELTHVYINDIADSHPLQPIQLAQLALVRVLDSKSTIFTSLLRRLAPSETAEVFYAADNAAVEIDRPLTLIQDGRTFVSPHLSFLTLVISPNATDPSWTQLELLGNRPEIRRALDIKFANCNPSTDLDLAHICRLDLVQELTFYDPANRGADARWWAATLVRMTGLQYLYLHLDDHPVVPEALVRALEAGDGPTPCPALKSLSVLGFVNAPEVWDALERVAAGRSARGVPLWLLWLMGPPGEDGEERIKALREHVLVADFMND